MTHLSEDDLILHYYSEPGAGDRERHLADCPECRERWRSLQLSLNLLDAIEPPEPAPDFEHRLLSRLSPQLRFKPQRSWLRWAIPIFALASLALAFWLGRTTHQPDGVTAIAYVAPDRVLLAETAHQLERSRLILMEAENFRAAEDSTDTLPRDRAEDLLASSRLLRRGARAQGQTQIAEVLEEVERVLLEIAHSPDKISPEEATALQARIREQSLLFRVRFLEKQLQTEVPTE